MKTKTALKALKVTTKIETNYFTKHIVAKLNYDQKVAIIKKYWNARSQREARPALAIIEYGKLDFNNIANRINAEKYKEKVVHSFKLKGDTYSANLAKKFNIIPKTSDYYLYD